jgi:hypothetical protein
MEIKEGCTVNRIFVYFYTQLDHLDLYILVFEAATAEEFYRA